VFEAGAAEDVADEDVAVGSVVEWTEDCPFPAQPANATTSRTARTRKVSMSLDGSRRIVRILVKGCHSLFASIDATARQT
jgi:hypothetical protein